MINFRTAVPSPRHLLPALHAATGVSTVVLLTCQTVAFWIALCGNSLPSVLALLTAIIVTVTVSALLQPLVRLAAGLPDFALPAALLACSTVAVIAMPVLLTETLSAAALSLTGESITTAFFRFLLPGAVVAIGMVPVALWLQQTCNISGNSKPGHAAGILAGILLVTCCLLPGSPANWAVLCGLIATATAFHRPAEPCEFSQSLPLQTTTQVWLTAIVTGAALASTATASLTITQPSLTGLFTNFALALLIVSAISMLTHILPGLRLVLKLAAPTALMLAPSAFPGLVYSNLTWAPSAHEAGLQTLQIAALLSMACTPLALSLSACRRQPAQPTSLILTVGMTIGASLSILSSQLLPALIQMQLFALLLASLTLFSRPEISAAGTSKPLPRPLPRMHLAIITVTAAIAAAVGTPDAAPLQRLMFSERTQVALQRNVDPELIPQSAPARLVEVLPTAAGEVSLWKLTGSLVEFRRNGIPQGAASSNPETTPQPPEDVLPLILALCNHPQPGHVLLLGDDAGAALRSCTHFPVQQITAIRQDPRITRLAAAHVWKPSQQNPENDTRVRISHQPAELAIRSLPPASIDAIVCSGPPASSMSAASLNTAEFYTAVHSALAAEGVFAQRFRSSDFGPEPLRQCLATLNAIFPASGALQTIPGEIVLLATNSDKGLISTGMLDRLQKEHVRTELSLSGWDWAQVAVLPLADANDPVGLFSTAKRPASLTAAAAQTTLNWPREASRNADKARELQAAFAPWQKQLASALPVTEAHHEAKRRLSSLAQQVEILAGMPDQPWTYRRSLRMEMQQHPRPPLEKVENGRIIRISHPLDQQRQQYFQSLGDALMAAARNEQQALELVRRLISFARSGDPLMGHFSHYEIVRLHELLKHPAPAEELQHRLHIVFFANPSDASVRPVISALDQLVRQPDLISQPDERFDQLNALLQKLIERWEARTAWEPKSATRVQNDVDQSVRISNLALDQMQELASSAGVSNRDIQKRRRYINQALIVPLRDYRDQVLAHRMKNNPAAPDGEDPDDQPLLVPAPQPLTTN
ncbi:MAG: spermidine synthase [Planctomycetaceae bacterium]